MKFKVDENLPAEIRDDLRDMGTMRTWFRTRD